MTRQSVTFAAVWIGMKEIRIAGRTHRLPECGSMPAWRHDGHMGDFSKALQLNEEYDTPTLRDLLNDMAKAGISPASITWDVVIFTYPIGKLPQALFITWRVLRCHEVKTRWLRKRLPLSLRQIQRAGQRP